MNKRTTVQIEANTRERFRQCQSWKKETDDVLLNMLIDSYPVWEASKCQICGKLCVADILKTPLKVKGNPDDWIVWKHKQTQNHPPYPASETSKKEALEDYNKLQKEMGKSIVNND